jgi:hypothetical protein
LESKLFNFIINSVGKIVSTQFSSEKEKEFSNSISFGTKCHICKFDPPQTAM